jgi:hypothetical protein
MIDELLGPDHPLKREMTIWFLVGLPVVAFGMVAGIRLWMAKPEAVMLVKVYLCLNLALGLLVIVLGPDYAPLREAMARKRGVRVDYAYARLSVIAFVWGILWFLIWFSYFHVSKRVKATFGV